MDGCPKSIGIFVVALEGEYGVRIISSKVLMVSWLMRAKFTYL